ncbi:cyclase family protein [uncultured Methanobrevibacter sp.]|uniref:cyclase family protein n=1 Tax=uncultured Methanobrevibacter sp. TaxID=253161 RepID=UPI002613040F|nr:cyclase family protein [uncultured Methanobrevibacter sp.]
MEYIDLTHKIENNLQEYPGDPKTNLEYFKKADENDSCTLLKLETGLHTGTHMDSPFHYIPNGKKISQLPLENFIGKASVNYVKSKSKEILVKNCNLKNTTEKIAIIITGWGKYYGSDKYFYNNPYISNELAELIIEKNIKGIAIDTCSVDKYGENTIHKKLLKNNIWIVENIKNSNKINKNSYDSIFIPLNIDAEASPIRAILKKD